MTETINTTTAPALPDEMVTRATKAMLRADGWTVQEIADQRKKGAGTTLRPFTAEILAEVALTAAGVPELLAETERQLDLARRLHAIELKVMKQERDAYRQEWASEIARNAQREATADLMRREREEARKALRILCQLIAWNGHRKWLDTIPTSRDVEAAVRRVLGKEEK